MDSATDNREATRTTQQTIVLERTVPSAPSGVTAVGGDAEVVIRWNNVIDAVAYNLYWSSDPNITKQTASRIMNITSPFKHTALSNGVTYYYIVTAINEEGESSESDRVSATPTRSQAPNSSFKWRQINKER